MYHPPFNPNPLKKWLNYKKSFLGEEKSSLQAYVQSFKASIQLRILSTLYGLNFSQTPSEKYWQEQSGIDKEIFNRYLIPLQKTQRVLKVGEVNGLGYYRISPEGVIVLQELRERLNKTLARLL